MMKSQFASACLFAVLVGMLSGCGGAELPELATLTGKVTMNDQPVPGVYIMATPEKGRPSYGTVGDDGTYTMMYKKDVEGATVGSSKISLTWPQGVSGPTIPEQYSNIDFDVVAGKNEYDIEMTSGEKAWKEFKPGAASAPID